MGVLVTSLHLPWQGRGAEYPSSAQKGLDRSDCSLNHISLHTCTGFGDSGYISGAETQDRKHSATQKGNMSFPSAPEKP